MAQTALRAPRAQRGPRGRPGRPGRPARRGRREIPGPPELQAPRGRRAAAGDPSWTEIIKSADQSIVNQVGQQNDTELFFTAVANGFYEVEVVIVYASPAGGGTPDLKWGMTDGGAFTQGMYLVWGISSSDGTQGGGLGNTSTVGMGTGTTKRIMKAIGVHAGNGSVLRFKWAQNTLDASNATIVYAGSLLRYRRIV